MSENSLMVNLIEDSNQSSLEPISNWSFVPPIAYIINANGTNSSHPAIGEMDNLRYGMTTTIILM